MSLQEWGWSDARAGHLAGLAGALGQPGRVVAQERDRWSVQTDEGLVVARVLSGAQLPHAPVVGDWITVAPGPSASDPWTVTHLLPRSSRLVRGAAGTGHQEQVLAANVDVVWVVHGLDLPLNERRVERYLAVIWECGAVPELILTKADLCPDLPGALARAQAIAPGASVRIVSSGDEESLTRLHDSLRPGATVAMVGPSGVGKSTLVNLLTSSPAAATGPVRERDGKGRHTTTRRQLYPIEGGGLLLDTPGIRELRLWSVDDGLDRAFPDVEELARACRFRDCRHESEPGCAVREAEEAGRVAPDRVASYRKLREEAEYQARKSDPVAQKAAVADHKTALKTMKYHQKRSALVAAFLLACCSSAACGGERGPSLEPVVRDSAGVVIQQFPAAVLERTAELGLAGAPAVGIGVVDGTPEYQWTRPVAAVRLSDGGFAVLEQVPAEIRVFDAAGRFLHRVASEGDGPGEFRSPVGLAVLAGDTLVVWDRGPRRVSWFTKEGTLVREQTLRQPGGIRTVRRVVLPRGGGVVALGATTTELDLGNQGRVRETWQVVRVGAGDGGGTVLGAVPGVERAIQVQGAADGGVVSVNVQGRWWWGEAFAWASRRGVWTADQLALEARHFDLERGLDHVVRVAAPDRPFTRALIDSLHQVELARVADPELRALWLADFEGREYPQTVPPVAGVFADAAGRAWIGLSDPPPEPLPSGQWNAIRRWAVFQERVSPRGGDSVALQALGVVTLPPRSHPLWADADGVLLVRNDAETDVAYIEWYPYMESGTPS